MTEEESFAAEAATLEMGNRLVEIAQSMAMLSGGSASAALFQAAMKMIEREMGNEHVVPIAKRWLETVIAAEDKPTGYN